MHNDENIMHREGFASMVNENNGKVLKTNLHCESDEVVYTGTLCFGHKDITFLDMELF